jgi:hypothetical protein
LSAESGSVLDSVRQLWGPTRSHREHHRWDDEFEPSASARNTLRWAHELGEEDTVEDVRQEFELGIDLIGADAPLSNLL